MGHEGPISAGDVDHQEWFESGKRDTTSFGRYLQSKKNDERGIKVKLTINWLDVIHFHDDFERNKRYLIKSR